MAILLAGDRGARMRPSMWGGSFEVGTDRRGHFIHPFPTAGGIARRLLELLAQVRLPHLAHQPVDRAADRRDLLQNRPAVGAGLECALKRSEERRVGKECDSTYISLMRPAT